jgi:hypothetical protein
VRDDDAISIDKFQSQRNNQANEKRVRLRITQKCSKQSDGEWGKNFEQQDKNLEELMNIFDKGFFYFCLRENEHFRFLRFLFFSSIIHI